MVIRLNDITKRTATEPLYQFVPKTNMVMFEPYVIPVEIVFVAIINFVFESNIIDFFFVDNFDLFNLVEMLGVLFENLLAVDSLELAGESIFDKVGATLRLSPGAIVGLG